MRRFNLIDVAAVVFALLVIPGAFLAYRVVRVPAPVMTSVTPETLPTGGPMEIRVTGEHFRPFLRAYASPAGTHVFPEDVPGDQRAAYLIQTPLAIELKLPRDLRAGLYDLYLFDEGREVARRASAFTLTAPPVRAPITPVGTRATLDLTVRFAVDPDIAPSIHVGDTDLNLPVADAPTLLAASLISWRQAAVVDPPRPRLAGGATLPVVDGPSLFESVVRLGAVSREGVWGYNNTPIRAGESFMFATSTYVIRGLVTRVTRAPDAPRATRP